MLPYPFAVSESAHQLAIESARVLVIDIFDDASFFEFGGA